MLTTLKYKIIFVNHILGDIKVAA